MQNNSLITQPIPFQFGEKFLNVLEKENEPWFIAKDVCSLLNHSNSRVAIASLDDDEKGVSKVYTRGGEQDVSIINESGLYSLILRSNKPEAKEFKRWVTHEVLPAIRKHGGYLTPQKTEDLINDPDLIIQLATSLKQERAMKSKLLQEIDVRNEVISEQETQIRIQAPAVDYYKKVLSATDTVNTNIIAKELGMSAVTLNKILNKEYKLIYKQGGTWLPSARIQNMGYTKTRTYTYEDHEGNIKSNIQMVWTQSGRHFIHELFKGRK